MTQKIVKSLFSRRRIIHFKQIFGVLFLFTWIVMGCKEQDENWEVYQNKEFDFTISYPEDWDTSQVDYRMLFGAREGYLDSLDLVEEGFNISATPSGNYTLDQIVTENKKTAKTYYPEAVIRSNDFSNDHGVKGKQLRLEYEMDGVPLAALSTFLIREQYLITITQTFGLKNNTRYEPIFDKMLGSFQWNQRE